MIIKNEIRKVLPIKDISNLFVVADFDRTITNGVVKLHGLFYLKVH